MRAGDLEITDLLWPLDESGDRLPVIQSEVVSLLSDRGQQGAARIVARMPSRGDRIDEAYLAQLAVRVHHELQRLGEELQLDRRVAALLRGPLRRLQASSYGPVRIVDVGCGTGHVIRAAAAHRYFSPQVELVGVDLNPVLIGEARRLARLEDLDCEFVAGNAFAPGIAITDPARTIVISTGLLHHLSEAGLADLFAVQARLGVAGFAHWDIAPCAWSTVGAWLFHQARMREPVSRHDGVLSARRAHSAETLLAAARATAANYSPTVVEGPRWYPRALDVLRPIIGTLS
ncbi:hypothetical protein GCM10027053_15400 [Intrasporangium mesophilum]